MFQRVFAAAIAGSIATTAIAGSITASASAQPTADNRGNYNSTQDWKKWEVIPDPGGLNCRKGPGVEFAIVAALDPKTTLDVSSNFSPLIQNDPRGNPWLAVSASDTTCFVRANSAFIRPAEEIVTSAPAAAPQSTPAMPQASQDGNYGNIQGWEKWEVVPLRTGLNCRKGPGVQFEVAVALDSGTMMTVSSERSPSVQNDPRQRPWLAVAVKDTICFVRAHRSFIKPAQ